MNNTDLLLRQQQLLSRSQQLRLSLADQSKVLERPLAAVDTVQLGLRWLYAHPLVPLGALALLVALRPSRAIRWTGRVWWLWKSWQRVQLAIQQNVKPPDRA